MSAESPSYRWNTSDAAEAYDQAAPAIHPYYETIQNQILDYLPFGPNESFLTVDLGGGSGRLAERVLTRFAAARVVVIDQSEPFLALAERRLAPFSSRASFIRSPLQDDWAARLPGPPDVILSTSAIHHLEPAEKQALFARVFAALSPGGILVNGDEFRPVGDDDYLALLEKWSQHMHAALQSGRIPASFGKTLDAWQERNIARFGEPRISGEDCLETIDVQLAYLREAGFDDVRCVWSSELWGIAIARKPAH